MLWSGIAYCQPEAALSAEAIYHSVLEEVQTVHAQDLAKASQVRHLLSTLSS